LGGAGLDIGAAVKAARLLKTGMTVEEVIKTTSKAHNIPEELLRGAYTASGKGTSDPKGLKNILTSALPKEVAEQAGKNVDVAVLSAEEFAKQTGSKTGNAVTKLVKGEDGVLRAQVIVREGANPNVLLEEAVHVAQLSDPKLTPKLAKLTEDNLANWPKMSTQQRLDVYKTKIELEIDAQQRLLQQYAKGDPAYAKGVQQNLDNLQVRLAEVDLGVKNPKSVEGEKWLDRAEPPRLFSKSDVLPERLWTSEGSPIPYGFKDEKGYKAFTSTLKDGLPEGTTALFQGSSVTGKKYTTGAVFDVGRTSDFDIALAGDELFTKARQLGYKAKDGTRIGPLDKDQLKRLGLHELANRLSEQADRPVNFMLFDSTSSAYKKPSIEVLNEE
jgi:hypothetical protein